MKIVLTGSTGFVGRHLVPKLVEEGFEVLELTRNKSKSEQLFGDTTKRFDLNLDHEYLVDVIEDFKPEVCIHLAAYLSSSDEYSEAEKLINSNIIFLTDLLDSLKKTNLKLFINTGTFAEYEKGDSNFDPAYMYAATKTASRSIVDYYSKVYQFKQVTVVPYTIYGGNDSQKKIIDIIYDSLDSEKPIDLSPGEQVLDFIHMSDVVRFYTFLLNNIDKLENKSNIPLGTGIGTSIRDLAKIIEKKTGKKANINWGGKSYRPFDIMYAVADTDQLRKIGWNSNLVID